MTRPPSIVSARAPSTPGREGHAGLRERPVRDRQDGERLGQAQRPRRNGVDTDSAKRGFFPEATRSVPSSSRTATPHEVGPCTSTPFWSAIPRAAPSPSCVRP